MTDEEFEAIAHNHISFDSDSSYDYCSDSDEDEDDEESPANIFRQAVSLMTAPVDEAAAKYLAALPQIIPNTFKTKFPHPTIDEKLIRLSYNFHSLLTEEETMPTQAELMHSVNIWMQLALKSKVHYEELIDNAPCAILHVQRAYLLMLNAKKLRRRSRDKAEYRRQYNELLATGEDTGPQLTRAFRVQNRQKKRHVPLLQSMMEKKVAEKRMDRASFQKSSREIHSWH